MHSQWGSALRNRGDLEGALRRLENAVRLSPSYLPAWHNLAAVRLERKEYAQAADGFRRVVALSPRAVEGWSGLGWSVEFMGEHREAADCYRRAMALDPSLIVVPTRLAELLATTEDAGLRDPVEALRLVELANRRTGGKNPYVLAALAAAEHANRNSRQAIVTAENALRTARDAELRDRLKTRLRAYRQENGPSVTEEPVTEEPVTEEPVTVEPVTEDQVNKKLVNMPSVDGETVATDMGGR
jgi:tetratricopeptide (TPR) repeat protein